MSGSTATLLTSLRRALSEEELARQGDRELLQRFAGLRDAAAFAVLVKRHGALVLGVCKRILHDHGLAEDAFQAVFVILAKRAGAIRKREALASWLFGVARRVAQQARRRQNRENLKIRQAADARRHADQKDLRWQEMLDLLEEELRRLPRCYQAPLLACYLEGRTQDEAARELGWPLGTLRRRLNKGREILRARLTRQGIVWSAGLFSLGFSVDTASAAALVELRQRTLQAVLSCLKGEPISQGVALMVQGSMHWAAGTTWKCLAVAVVLCCGVAGLGAVWSAAEAAREPEHAAAGAEPVQPPGRAQKRSDKTTDQSLPEGAVTRLGSLRFNHGDGLRSLHYTPDGKTIVSYGGGSIRLWDSDSGHETKQFSTGNSTHDPTVLLDGKTLLSWSLNMEALCYWDLEQGKQSRTVRLPVPRGAFSKWFQNPFSPDGRLVVIQTDVGVDVFETTSGKPRFRTNRRGDDIQTVTFSGDSKTLIQSSKDGVLEVWDAQTGKPLKIFDQNLPAHILASSPDGHWLATLEHHTYAIDKHLEKDVVHVWDLNQAKEAYTFTAKGWFMGVQFTLDSKRLMARRSTMQGWSYHGWDLASGKEIPDILPQWTQAKAFHPDGKRFLAGGSKFDQWDSATGKRLSSDDSPYAWARTMCFDSTAERIVTFGFGSITSWDVASGKRLNSLEVPYYANSMPAPIFTSDAKLALTYQVKQSDYDIEMVVWDVARGTKKTLSMGDPPKRYSNAHAHISPSFTPDGTRLVARQPGYEQSMIRIWDLKTGLESKQIPETKAGHSYSWHAYLLADGRTLVIPGLQAVGIDIIGGTETFAWQAPVRIPFKDGKEPAQDPNKVPPWRSFAITPDGKTAAYLLLTGYGRERVSNRIVLCDGKTGRLLRRLDDSGISGRDSEQLAFSADGRRLASTDGRVTHVWDVATGAKLRTLTGHIGEVHAIVFSQDGRRLASASADSTVLIWNLADSNLSR